MSSEMLSIVIGYLPPAGIITLPSIVSTLQSSKPVKAVGSAVITYLPNTLHINNAFMASGNFSKSGPSSSYESS